MKNDVIVFLATAILAVAATALPGQLIKPGARGSWVVAARADSVGGTDTTYRDTTFRDTTSRDTTRRDSTWNPWPGPKRPR
jgi:hypothetical protein